MTENYLYFVLISYLSALVLFVTYFFYLINKLKKIEKELTKKDMPMFALLVSLRMPRRTGSTFFFKRTFARRSPIWARNKASRRRKCTM